MSIATSQSPEQDLTFDEWAGRILPGVLGIPLTYAMSVSKNDFAADALTLPSLRVSGRPVYVGFAEKAAALIAAFARARVVRYRNNEVALATAVGYLQKNGRALHIPPEAAPRLEQLIRRVARRRASETQLAHFLDHFLTTSSEAAPFSAPRVIVYVAIAETLGDPEYRAHLYDVVEDSSLAVVSTLREPIDLASTAPGRIERPPEEDWQTRRGAIVRGDLDPEQTDRAAPAGGMIAVTAGPGDLVLGLELARIGPRTPVLVLHPADEEAPSALAGYARTEGNIRFAPFATDEDIVSAIASFLHETSGEMVRLARARRDASLTATPLQHRLRHRYMRLSPEELDAVLAKTGLTIAYLFELLTEPTAYSRAEWCDIVALANALGEALEDHVSRPALRSLSRPQLRALKVVVRRRKLPPSKETALRERGEALASYPHGRVGLGEPEDWEALMVGSLDANA